ncbi:MAG TPA: PrsW family glutamic-type intramembrane protease [Nitriliruptorales bacterium]
MGSLATNPAFYFALAVVQAMVLVTLVRYLDFYDRQPMAVVAVAAVWGATGAAALSLFGNDVLTRALSGDVELVFGDAIAPPLVEEAAKGLALIAAWGPIRWLARRAGVTVFGGVGAGIVYGAAVGVGFSFTEDIWFLFNSASSEGLEAGVDLFLHRRDFFGPAVIHHSVFTAAFGAGLGLAAWRKRGLREVLYPLAGFLVAVTLHAANNGLVEVVLVLQHGVETTADWVRGFVPDLDATASTIRRLMRVVDFYYLVAFFGGVILWTRYQRRIILAELVEEASAGLITQRELSELFERGASRRLLVRGQLERWRHRARLRSELARLGLLKWRTRRFGGDWSRVQRVRRQIATLATYDVVPTQLPAPTSAIIGRARELDELTALIADRSGRLLTLTGPGGTGKTRLALALADRVGDRFASGVWYIELAPVSDPELVPTTIAHALDVPEVAGKSVMGTLTEFLRDKQSLLVLDNFEQVIEASSVVAELLASAPRLTVLVTSRHPLRASGERGYPVPPLALPGDGEPSLDAVAASPAVALFVERARSAAAEFELDANNAAAVAAICARLDGLPLAIELAAARAKVLDPAALLERLGQSLDLLTTGASDLPSRHQTLRGTIDWSHGLLGPDEQIVFARFSVFVDGAPIETVEAVCRDDSSAQQISIVDALGSLLDESLLRRVEGKGGRVRFVMLETIKEYAFEKLEERGEVEVMRSRLARYVMELSEQAESELQGPDQVGVVDRLDAGIGNVRAALSWSLQSGDLEVGMRIAGALSRFWSMAGYAQELQRWLAEALSQDVAVPPRVRARALYADGYASLEGDHARGQRSFEQSLEIHRELGDVHGMASSLAQLSVISMLLEEFEAAALMAEEAAELARTVPDRQIESVALYALAECKANQGDYDGADELYRRCLELRRTEGGQRMIANALVNLGHNDLLRGDDEGARRLLAEGLELSRSIHDGWSVAVALTSLGRLEVRFGDRGAGVDLLGQALDMWVARADQARVAETLDGLAEVADADGDHRRVAVLTAAADALRRERARPIAPADRDIRRDIVQRARAALGEDGWADAGRAGDVSNLDEIRALVRSGGNEPDGAQRRNATLPAG